MKSFKEYLDEVTETSLGDFEVDEVVVKSSTHDGTSKGEATISIRGEVSYEDDVIEWIVTVDVKFKTAIAALKRELREGDVEIVSYKTVESSIVGKHRDKLPELKKYFDISKMWKEKYTDELLAKAIWKELK